MTITAIKLSVFAVVTVVLVYLSRASLSLPRSHGFWRLFAWEAIVALILINLDSWFREPLSVHQVISWILLSASAFLVIHVAHLLRTAGRPDPRRSDEGLLGLEKTTRLVRVGAFRYIRHPAYASLLLLAWGAFFKRPTLMPGVLAVAATILLVLTARAEEVENIVYFGPRYREYMRGTKMFVPFLF